MPWSDKLPQKHFKPSTKEAFDAQNQPESVNNNGFFVALQNKLTSHPSAEITQGKGKKADMFSFPQNYYSCCVS